MLNGTYVINNPFWWTADDKFFNYSVVAEARRRPCRRRCCCPQKGYPVGRRHPAGVAAQPGLPARLGRACSSYIGLPAILKPYSGGGWKHVYKVHNKEELWAAYDGTSPYCMTLQEFIDFDHYVRCFTFGKTDIMPVAYDPKERQVPGDPRLPRRPSSASGSCATRRRSTQALGYEMNTVEFAIKDGVPYAIDFLNPAPDFERDRITQFYFDIVVEKMARLVIDRAAERRAVADSWPKWPSMVGPEVNPIDAWHGAAAGRRS